MLYLIALAFAEDPMATLFVENDGSYLLSIHLEEEWRNAELHFKNEQLHYNDWPREGLYHQGVFTDVPKEIRVNMELAAKSKGAYLSLYVPTIPLPESAPSLEGEAYSPLPKSSFQWWLWKRLRSIESGLSIKREVKKELKPVRGGFIDKDAP